MFDVHYAISDDALYTSVLKGMGGYKRGIYRLHVKELNGQFAQITRLLGVDPFGILYIGVSDKVADRIGSLRRSIMACFGQIYIAPNAHQVGKRLQQSPAIRDRFPLERFWVSVDEYTMPNSIVEGDDAWGHYGMEAKALTEYRQNFGEHPPLNT